jgi:hypothetical protein
MREGGEKVGYGNAKLCQLKFDHQYCSLKICPKGYIEQDVAIFKDYHTGVLGFIGFFMHKIAWWIFLKLTW